MKNLKTYFIIIFLFFFKSITYSQNIDSLKSAINTLLPNEKIKAFITISEYYFYSNPDTSLYYMKEGIQFAKENEFKKQELYLSNNLGIFYNEGGEFIKAKETLLKVLEQAKELKDTMQIISTSGNLGNIYMNTGYFETALSYFTRVVKMYEEIRSKKGVAFSYGAIGNLYNKMYNNKKAIQYYDLSKKIFKEINDTISIAIIKMNTGLILYRNNEKQKAINNLKEAYNFFERNKIHLNAGKCLQDLSIINLKEGNLDLSIKNSLKSLQYFQKVDSKVDVSLTYMNLGNCYIKKKQYKKSIQFLKKAYDISFEEENIYNLKNITKSLAECYENVSDYKKSTFFLKKYQAYNDSIYNTETTNRFNELEVKYETSQKEQKIKILEKTQEVLSAKQERNFWIITGLVFLGILSGIIFLLVHNSQKLKAKQKTIEIEQKLLRLQMNPHFIFNAIFAIQGYLYDNDTEKTSMYLSNFAKLMRLILENSRKDFITLDEEINMLNYYIQFQKLRLEYDFKFNLNISKNIDTDNVLIPPMIIQPFIENSIEHGFSKEIENPFIEISLKLEKDTIFVKVEDNGKGFQKKNINKKHKSLATEITKERLSILYKKNNKRNSDIKIEYLNNDKNTGTIINFQIPLIEEF